MVTKTIKFEQHKVVLLCMEADDSSMPIELHSDPDGVYLLVHSDIEQKETKRLYAIGLEIKEDLKLIKKQKDILGDSYIECELNPSNQMRTIAALQNSYLRIQIKDGEIIVKT